MITPIPDGEKTSLSESKNKSKGEVKMEKKDIVCPDCGETISKWADVCVECGYPNNEYEERLSKDNVRAKAKARYIEGANSYEVVDVEYHLDDTELEIIAYIRKTEESDDCDGEGDRFWLTMFDPNGDDVSSGRVDMPYMEVGETNDVWIKAKIDRMGTYSILVELE
jgi:ribosomal protein L37E